MTLTADGTGSGKTASKTVNVVVSGVPLTITEQPKDNVMGQKDETGFSGVSIYVTASRTDGVSYQWKLADGTALSGQTDSKLFLVNIPEDVLTQDAENAWRRTARVYCTASYNGYTVDSDVVTVIVSTCDHAGLYDTTGRCKQCGASTPKSFAFVDERGNAYQGVMLDSMAGANETLYLLRDINEVLHGTRLPENVTLDLNGHTIYSIGVDLFQNATIQNGAIIKLKPWVDENLNCGTLTLKGVTVTDEATIGSGMVLRVDEKCVFKSHVTISGETRLSGGTFEKGVSDENGAVTPALLADGYACADADGRLRHWDALLSTYYMKIVQHTCTNYAYGKCTECARACTHPGVQDGGICPICKTAKSRFPSAGSIMTRWRTR